MKRRQPLWGGFHILSLRRHSRKEANQMEFCMSCNKLEWLSLVLMLPDEIIPLLSDGFLTYCYLNESPYTIITFFMFRVFLLMDPAVMQILCIETKVLHYVIIICIFTCTLVCINHALSPYSIVTHVSR